MNLKNIHSLRVYQAVKFDSKLSTFFVTKATAQYRPVSIEIIEGIGVNISTEKDSVIIPFANISGIYMNTEHKTEKIQARKDDLAKKPVAISTKKIKSDPAGAKRL